MANEDRERDISEEELRRIHGDLSKAVLETTKRIDPNIVTNLTVKFPSGSPAHFSDWHDKFGDKESPFKDAFGKAGGLGAVIISQLGPKPKP